MRNEAFLIAGAAAALMATACDKASNITGPEVAYAKPAFNLAAGSHTVTQDDPWLIATENPCNGEQVIGNGSTHIVMGSQFDNTGGLHVSIERSSSGSGVGDVSGPGYTVSEQTTNSDKSLLVPEQFTWFDEDRLLINAPKSVDNFIMHVVWKVAITPPDFVPTISPNQFFMECVG